MAQVGVNLPSFFDPYQNNLGVNPNLPGFPGLPRKPGESDKDYQLRLMEAQRPYQQANIERQQIEKLAGTEEAKSRAILGEQTKLQEQRLSDLASLLAKQQDAKFNRDIPDIAETAQGQGFLETSGFGNALAKRYKDLTAQTSEELARQALTDRDLAINSTGQIGQNANDLYTSGLERQFSVTDNAKSEALARELAKYGVPTPAKGPSTTDKLLQYGGPVLSGVGAVKGATNASPKNSPVGWDSLLP